MSIFKKKLEGLKPKELPVDPIELFQSLFHTEGYSYLRGIQEEVLKIWHSQRAERDVLCKMNTGSGKTLTGLLMLYSKMQEGIDRGIYLCPDRQLVNQTVNQAKLYGVPVCEIEGNKFPADFINNESILVCTFQRLFTGRSIFKRDNIEIGSILIDDAHVCVDKARENTTIKLDHSHALAQKLLRLFTESLTYQSTGTFKRLMDGDPYASVIKVPYWTWADNILTIISLINEYANEENPNIMFPWDLIADDLLSFDCYVGPNVLEISPIHVPYHNIRSFNEAKHRFILSATFEDNVDLIKDLGLSKKSIASPIIPKNRKDLGQRLILAPNRFDSKLTEDQNRKLIRSYVDAGYNVVVLVPGNYSAKPWEELGATMVDKNNIDISIDKLKNSKKNFLVFVNRYDGLDLSAEMCRILVLDGYPLFSSLKDQYTASRLESMRSAQKAQIIEQGLGRGVRSGSDYCVVFLLGLDLLGFLGNKQNLDYFTPITRKQITLGLTLLDGESKNNSIQTIKETALACLTQEKEWRSYHSSILNEVEHEVQNDYKLKKLSIAEIEAEALLNFKQRNYKSASTIIIDKIVNEMNLSPKETGWYLQFAAQLIYLHNKVESNNLQVKAIKTTTNMFQPIHGYEYVKITAKGSQSALIINNLSRFERPQDLSIYVEDLIRNLQYNPDIDAKLFENSLAELGRLLGFNVQESEKELGNGPDVLWCMSDSHYLILEAKSRSQHSEISRDNIGQLLQSIEWFKKTYGSSLEYTPVTLQPSKKKGENVNPSPNTKVLDQDSLNELNTNLRHFSNSLSARQPNSYTASEINLLLQAHSFTPTEFRAKYLKNIK